MRNGKKQKDEQLKLLISEIDSIMSGYTTNEKYNNINASNYPEELIPLINSINKINSFSCDLINHEKDNINMINKIINSGMWRMYFNENREIVRVIWSDEFRKMIGFNDTNDFPNTVEAWSDKLHPEDKDDVLSQFNACVLDDTGTVNYDVDYRLQIKTGEYKWYKASGRIIRDNNNKPISFIGIFVDISIEKQNKRQLDLLLQRHNAIDSVLIEGSWSMNVVGKDPSNPNNIFWWSDQFRKLLGYNDENDFPNVLNSWSDKLHPDEKQSVLDAFNKHILDYSGKTPYNLEYRLLHKDGKYRWFRAVGDTVRESDGTPIVIAGAVSDITESKKSHEIFESDMGQYIK